MPATPRRGSADASGIRSRDVSPGAEAARPQLPTLQRIAAVLDEELLVCFQRTVDGEVERELVAVA
jgi:hypothetical protein